MLAEFPMQAGFARAWDAGLADDDREISEPCDRPFLRLDLGDRDLDDVSDDFEYFRVANE